MATLSNSAFLCLRELPIVHSGSKTTTGLPEGKDESQETKINNKAWNQPHEKNNGK